MTDEALMRLALKEAGKARNPFPNPFVGALVVKNGRVIARGFHEKAGCPHAERAALERAGSRAKGATLVVTLEPCVSRGRTPPCAPAIVDAGITRVVIGMRDETATNRGGAEVLRKAGLEVVVGVLEQECRLQNQVWLKSVAEPLPYMTLKMAMYPDGTTVPKKKWISGAVSRREVQRQRSQHDAVLVGRGTVIADDPRLTVRMGNVEKQPARIVVGSGDFPQGARMLQEEGVTYFVTHAGKAPRGVVRMVVPQLADSTLDIVPALAGLKARGVGSVLVEGGAETANALVRQKLIDSVVLFVPGDSPTPPSVWGLGTKNWDAEKSGVDTKYVRYLRRY